MSNRTVEQFLADHDTYDLGAPKSVVTRMIEWIEGLEWSQLEDCGQIHQCLGDAFVLGVRLALADPERWAAFCKALKVSVEHDRLELAQSWVSLVPRGDSSFEDRKVGLGLLDRAGI